MKKNTFKKILIGIIIIAIIAVTIITSYYGSLLFTSVDFKIGYLLPFIGFLVIDLFLVGLSFKLAMDVIGGDKK